MRRLQALTSVIVSLSLFRFIIVVNIFVIIIITLLVLIIVSVLLKCDTVCQGLARFARSAG